MIKYVALLRGIAPMNPNMRNDILRGVFEKLGFAHVQTVISSGNVLFKSDSQDTEKLEKRIEQAIPQELGFSSTTIIRSQEQLQKLVKKNPFDNMEHTPKTYLDVTFLQQAVK